MLVPMEVQGLALDPDNNSPVVLLRDHRDKQILPIWVGVIEASAIAFELESVPMSRPMTHALFVETVQQLGAKLVSVTITDLRESTYFAQVEWRALDKTLLVDARPSDAIALALRAKAPIFCDSSVIEQVQRAKAPVLDQAPSLVSQPGAEATAKELPEEESSPKLLTLDAARQQDALQQLSDEDFGKYKM